MLIVEPQIVAAECVLGKAALVVGIAAVARAAQHLGVVDVVHLKLAGENVARHGDKVQRVDPIARFERPKHKVAPILT